MTLDYKELYQALLAAIENHQQSDRSEMEKVEACFKCSLDFWGKLQKQIKRTGFQTPQDEVHFFKKIKHRFTAYIEYYTCRYHAILFRPGEDALDQARFWRWELRKIEKFKDLHAAFYEYIHDDHSDKDEEYFLRAGNFGVQVMAGRIHDLDPGTATPGDYLLTMMGAYELYETHILEEMKKLGGYFFLTK